MKLIETIQIVKAAGEQSLLLGKKGKVYTNVSPVKDNKDCYKVSFGVYYGNLTVDTMNTAYLHDALEMLKEIKQITNECEKFKDAENGETIQKQKQ